MNRHPPGNALTDDQRFNQRFWDVQADDYDREHGPGLRQSPLAWGAFRIPERAVHVLGDLEDAAVVELGCGVGYRIAEMARMSPSARCYGIDISRRQLELAKRATNSEVSWIQAAATALPLPTASVDLIISDFGALTYDEPTRVLAECARILRRGGRLIFNTASPLAHICASDDGQTVGTSLRRGYTTLGRHEDADGITWTLAHGAWIRLAAAAGLSVERLIELPLQLSPGLPASSEKAPASLRSSVGSDDGPWYQRFPAENLWCLKKH